MRTGIDADIQAMLDRTAAIEMPPLRDQPVEQVRLAYDAFGMLEPLPDSVAASDLTIPGPAGDLPARMYRTDDRVRPGLLYLHGGGHVIGSLTSHQCMCAILAEHSGCAVVAVDHRLAPEHPFPADVEDAMAATEWFAEHAGELAVDGDRLGVGGDSAGGNLATVAARCVRDAGGPALAFQLLIYPWVDLECNRPSMIANATGRVLEADALEFWRELYVGGDEALFRHPDVSAIYADDLSNLPPAVVVTAGGDPLHDQGREYAQRLEASGVEVRHLGYDDLIHAFAQLTALSARARSATEEIGREVAKVVGRVGPHPNPPVVQGESIVLARRSR